MGFFDGFLGGIKNIGKSVVGAVKTVGKKIGDAGQAVLDFSRDHGVGTTLQNIGAASTVAGVALASTGVLAPLAAVAEGVGGAAFLGGTGIRAAEIASNKSKTAEQKVVTGLTDVAAPLVLPSVLRAGTRAAAGLSRAGLSAAKPILRKGVVKALKSDNVLAAKAIQAARGIAQKGVSKIAGVADASKAVRTAPERFASAKRLPGIDKEILSNTVKNVALNRSLQKPVAKAVATGATYYSGLEGSRDAVKKNQEINR